MDDGMWINGRRRVLDPDDPYDAALIAQKAARQAADAAEAQARDAARARRAAAEARRDALARDVGDALDLAAVLAEGLDGLAQAVGQALPPETAAAIAKIRAIRAAHPRGR